MAHQPAQYSKRASRQGRRAYQTRPDDEETLYRSCLRKRSFESNRAARAFGKKHGQKPYTCPHCGRWHLTSKR